MAGGAVAVAAGAQMVQRHMREEHERATAYGTHEYGTQGEGLPVQSAYQRAVASGYHGTQAQWFASLEAADPSAGTKDLDLGIRSSSLVASKADASAKHPASPVALDRQAVYGASCGCFLLVVLAAVLVLRTKAKVSA